MSSALPPVTVVMPVRDESAFIRESLGAVLAQDYPADRLEVLVVDGMSTDDTVDIVSSMASEMEGAGSGPGVVVLENPDQIQSAALNLGIRRARGEIVIRVDGHSFIAPDYVRTCVSLLRERGADNVGGRMVPVGSGAFERAVAIATSHPFGIGDSKFHFSTEEQWVDTVYLGAYRKETLERIGMYDARLRLNEDYELNYRLRRAGGRILLSPDVHSTYRPRASLRALVRQYFMYGRWKARVLRAHPASLARRQVVPPAFVMVLLLGLLFGWWSALLRVAASVALGLYVLCAAGASVHAARKASLVPLVFCVFVSLHLSWGSGVLVGAAWPPGDAVPDRV